MIYDVIETEDGLTFVFGEEGYKELQRVMREQNLPDEQAAMLHILKDDNYRNRFKECR